ncbi:MAG: ATP-binding protein [Hyphomonadaceae bacterium]|nr:ATP-binding protein [Hyphomonadaceae bacterium]
MHHVTQLRDALAKQDSEQAAKLTRLLTAASKRQDMTPVAFEEMRQGAVAVRARLGGELLTRNTPIPHDRESGAALVRIVFPDDPGGLEPVFPPALAEAVRDLLAEWRKLDRLAELRAAPHLRCLLYGEPGVGKTQLARYIARHLDLPCVEARLDGLVSSFLGTTARNIGVLFDFANRYRCVLFLDEFDALAKARDDAHELGEIKRVVNTLLQCLDAREGRGFTIAATNHEHLLDSAVWRRFDARIKVPKPDAGARAQILEGNLRPVELDGAARALLDWMTDGLTGADIASVASAVKRYMAVHGEAGGSPRMYPAMLLAALRRYAVMNAKQFDPERVDALTGSREALDKVLVGAGLNQTERAEILGVSQSTISRSARSPGRSRKRGMNGQS